MTTTNHFPVMPEHALRNGNAAPETTGTAHKAVQQNMQNDTTLDPLQGWFGLAAGVKQSKLRQMKRGWQRKGGRS